MKKLIEEARAGSLFFKFDLKMKMTSIFLLVTLFNIHANSFSQKDRLTLDVIDGSIIEVINEIESKTDFRFIYKLKDVDVDSRVSLQVVNERINKILDRLFSGKKIKYSILDRQIVLKKKDVSDIDYAPKPYVAPPKKIKGTLRDENGIPLLGVNVFIKGSSTGTSTDFDGNYEIIAEDNDILVFSYLGFFTQEIPVADNTTIDVVLIENAQALKEVVVQAYRNTSLAKNSAAITTVAKEVVENTPNTNALNALQARVAGLNIASGSGQPGAATTVRIRGTGTFSGNAEPLYVIDGTPVSRNFQGINPNDIESISVLKDGAASAVYGNRGANGVIIITTKKGSYNSGLQVSYSESTGRAYQQENTFGLMNSRDLLNLQQTLGAGRGATLTDSEINVLAKQNNTDWTKIILQKGEAVNRQLSFSVGGKNIKSYTSLAYTRQEGLVKTTGLERYTLRSNIAGKSTNEKFKYGVDFTVAGVKIDDGVGGLGDGQRGLVFLNPLVAAIWSQPYLNPFKPDGTINDDTLDELPPLSGAPYVVLNNFRYNVNQSRQLKSVVNANMSYELLNNVTIGGRVGIDYEQNERLETRSPESTSRLFNPTIDAPIQGRQRESFFRDFTVNATGSLNYTNTFGKHTLDATAFIETLRVYRKSFGFAAFGLDPRTFAPGDGASFTDGNLRIDENPNDDIPGDNLFVPDIASDRGEAGLFSYFGIADYDYDSRFGLTATIRRDASFRFATTNRWGTFYSLSGRWNMDQEDFIKSTSFINTLKLRASFGTTGNERVFGADILAGASAIRTLYSTGTGYNNTTSLVIDGGVGSTALRWETTEQTNIGLDYGLFDNRLSGSLDVYRKDAVDLFLGAPVSAVIGQSNITQNVATLRNQGIELAVSYDLLRSDKFNLTLRANGSINDNEILDLGNQPDSRIDNGATIQAVGSPINSYFLVPYVGVNPANGNALYRKLDGSLTEVFSNDDRVITGSVQPKYQGGFGLKANYKGFFIRSDFSFLAGVERYNDQLRFFSTDPLQSINFNVSADYNRAWTPENPITDVEGLFSTRDQFGSTKFLQDASYIRLRDFTIGYDFTESISKILPINSLKFYASGQNLLTWSKWRGLDVENAVNRLFAFSDFPTPRIFTVGIDITL